MGKGQEIRKGMYVLYLLYLPPSLALHFLLPTNVRPSTLTSVLLSHFLEVLPVDVLCPAVA